MGYSNCQAHQSKFRAVLEHSQTPLATLPPTSIIMHEFSPIDPPGADFTFETQVLTFSPDVDQLSVDFTILEDIIVEMQESFMFTLSLPMDPPPGYIAGPFATVAILDDDCMYCAWGKY